MLVKTRINEVRPLVQVNFLFTLGLRVLRIQLEKRAEEIVAERGSLTNQCAQLQSALKAAENARASLEANLANAARYLRSALISPPLIYLPSLHRGFLD